MDHPSMPVVPSHDCFGYMIFMASKCLQSHVVHGFCKEENVSKMLQSLDVMCQQRSHVTEAHIAGILQCCIKENDLSLAKDVYSTIQKYDLGKSSRLKCQLIRLFADFGSLADAMQVFHTFEEQNVYAWSTIISVHAGAGEWEQTLTLYDRMQRFMVKPSFNTIVAALKACTSLKFLGKGKVIHDNAITSGLDLDSFIGSALVDMYAKCFCLEEAANVFERLPDRDVVLWCAMIGGFAEHGHGLKALECFDRMQIEGIEPNKITLVCLLKACISSRVLDRGRDIHAKIVRCGYDVDTFSASALVDMYVKCDHLVDARSVFDKLANRSIVSWNVMISGYADDENFKETDCLLKNMKQKGIPPDAITYTSVLRVCGIARNIVEGYSVHTDILKAGLDSDLRICSTLLDFYAKCGFVDTASKIFDRLPKRDLVSWSSMISAYVENGLPEEAFGLFLRMQEDGIQPDAIMFVTFLRACGHTSQTVCKLIHSEVVCHALESDSIVGSALMALYIKCGSLDDAQNVFNCLSSKSSVAWNSIISAYVETGNDQQVFQCLGKAMQEGIWTDDFNLTCMVKSCSNSSALDFGRFIHAIIIEKGSDANIQLANSLVDMYGKCFSIEDALYVFNKLEAQTVVSWSALILGFTECGYLDEAIFYYEAMKSDGLVPNDVTYLCILKTYASQIAIRKGLLTHMDIVKQGFSSEHVGNSLIDMYAKFCKLDDAYNIFASLADKSVVSWCSLIVGFSEHGRCEEALFLFNKMQDEGLVGNEVIYVCILKSCSNLASLTHGSQVHVDIMRKHLLCISSIANTLVDMYSKSGDLLTATDIFNKITVRDLVTWNALIGGYAEHGYYEMVELYFGRMQADGIKPDPVTFVNLLTACSHVGLVSEGYMYFKLMSDVFGIMPIVDHYVCLIDVLGRVGRLIDAEEFAHKLPFPPNSVMWSVLLSSCVTHYNLEVGKRAFEILMKVDEKNVIGHVLMSNSFLAYPI